MTTAIGGVLFAIAHAPLFLPKNIGRFWTAGATLLTAFTAIYLTWSYTPESGSFAGVAADGYFAPDGLSALFTYLMQGLCVLGIFFALGRDLPKIALYAMLIFQLSAWVVVSTDRLILFLFAWEAMGLATFLLALNGKSVRPALNYLVQMHVGGACLFAAYLLSGSETWSELKLTGTTAALMAVGFGFKAGLAGLHTWMGPTYASVMRPTLPVFGLAVNLGIYGLARIYTLLPEYLMFAMGTAWVFWGVAGSLYGVALACVDGDAIRVPAFSTMENMGLITTALGAAALGSAGHVSAAAAPAFTGAMLHVVNHAVVKSLLFFTAVAAVENLSSTRLNAGGGLMKAMPPWGALALFASVALCGLPPLNAFSSELLIYLALFQDLERTETFSLIASLTALLGLCLAGGLSIFALARWFGVLYLGRARDAQTPRFVARGIRPAVVPAVVALAIGLSPGQTIAGVKSLLHSQAFETGPMDWTTWAPAAVLILVVALRFSMNEKKVVKPVWGCGFAKSTPKMQYTAHAFSQSLGVFQREKTHGLKPIFPENARFRWTITDPWAFVLRRASLRFIRLFRPLSFIQTGRVQDYILYAFVFILVLTALTLIETR